MLALWWLANRTAESATRPDGLVLVSTTAGPMYEQLSLRVGQLGSDDLRLPGRPLLPLWNNETVTRAMKRIMCRGTLETEIVDFQREQIRSDLDLDAAGWRNTDWQAMRSYRIAMDGFDVRDQLHQIELPTVILHGGRDSLFSVRAAEQLAEGLPNGRLRIVEEAGHALPLTHGEEIVAAVQELLP